MQHQLAVNSLSSKQTKDTNGKQQDSLNLWNAARFLNTDPLSVVRDAATGRLPYVVTPLLTFSRYHLAAVKMMRQHRSIAWYKAPLYRLFHSHNNAA